MITTNEEPPSLLKVNVFVITTGGESFDRLIRHLEHEYGMRTTTGYDTNHISVFEDIDCVIGSPCFTEHSDLKSLEAMQAACPDVPIILFYEDETTAAQMLHAGADRCIRYDRHQTAAQAAHVAATLRQELQCQQAKLTLKNEIEFVRRSFDAHDDILFAFDLDGDLVLWNEKLNEVTGYSDAEIYEMAPADFISAESVEPISVAIGRAVSNGRVKEQATLITKDNEHIPYEFTGILLEDDTDNAIGICGTGRDTTDRKRRERVLEYHAERLDVLNRLNEIMRDVHQALVRTSTREEIEQAVCVNLVSEDAYRFAWIGEQRMVDERIEPRALAGFEDALDDRHDHDERNERSVTAETVIETSRAHVAQSIADESAVVSWREATLERDYRSAVAIPLVYRETTYGVLCLYSSRSNAFDETERAVLEELGVTIGYAFSAAECRRALVSDAVVELEFVLRDRSIFTLDLTARTECRVTLDGIVECSDGMLVEFVTVTGAAPETVLDIAADWEDIDVTLISEHSDESVFQLTSELSSTVSLADQGGIIRKGVAEDGEGHLVFEFPQGADVHAIVNVMQDLYSETELVAQRTRERTSTRGAEFRATFDDALTDRQKETLKAAYFSGFFEWPRENTGDEIAASFDISGPTFHEHIRAGQRKLLKAFIEHGSETE